MKHFFKHAELDTDAIAFSLGVDRAGKPCVHMVYTPTSSAVQMVTAPAVTMWPRCTGDGNFGTMWGPNEVTKAKFTLDLTDNLINGAPNAEFDSFKATLDCIDDRLLDFVTENQLKILGRKNLTKEEVKMLQIRTVRPKYDKISGALNGHSVNFSTSKFAWDGMGGKFARKITICDHLGQTVPNGAVCPGDVVAATAYANQVYTGVGGDKFGIHWGFQDVSVLCQRANLEEKPQVDAFTSNDWAFSKPYVETVSEVNNYHEQFSAA